MIDQGSIASLNQDPDDSIIRGRVGVSQTPVEAIMDQTHRLQAELDTHELASLQRFVAAIQEDARRSVQKVEVAAVFRGAEGQIFVPVVIAAATPDAHLTMLMERKAEQLYKQSGCRFVLLQQLETDPQRYSYVWAEGTWKTTP
jgi:hypothetical protein